MRINTGHFLLIASIAFGLFVATIQKMAFEMFCTAMSGTTGPLPEATGLALRIQAKSWRILIMGTFSLVLLHKFVPEQSRTILYVTYVGTWLIMSLFSHYGFAIGLESRLLR